MNDVSSGNSENITVLFSTNADDKAKNNIGNTVLMLSVITENAESVRSLQGADIVIIRNNTRKPVINQLSQVDDKTIIELIRKYEKEKKLVGVF